MIVNGTTYDDRTDPNVVWVLENARIRGERVRLEYGDRETGKVWMEEYDVDGTLGRSMGPQKVPILLHNTRSTGGGCILGHCILRVQVRAGKGWRTVYQHPKRQRPPLAVHAGGPMAEYPWEVLLAGGLQDQQARFRTEKAARRYCKRWED